MTDRTVVDFRSRERRPRPLLRTVLGEVLRRTRQRQGRTLADVADAAKVSMPYLSELERGRKEASSEVLAAVCDALRVELSDVLAEVRHELVDARAVPTPLLRLGTVGGLAGQGRPGGIAPPGPGGVTCLLAA